MAAPFIRRELQDSFRQALRDARDRRHEYLLLEHLLLALTRDPKVVRVLSACGVNVQRLRDRLEKFLVEEVETLPKPSDAMPQQTLGIERVLQRAAIQALSTDRNEIDAGDVLVTMFRENDSRALSLLKEEGLTQARLLDELSPGRARGEADDRRVVQVTLPRDVWVGLVRYRSEREVHLERDVSTAEALEELLRKALALGPPSPPASDSGE